jgi:hypothetical protein
MATAVDNLVKQIEEAEEKYRQYVESQSDAILAEAQITIEQSDENRTDVHMNVSYKDANYHFESIKNKDVENFHTYLNSQPLVKKMHANGEMASFQATAKTVEGFSDRFNPNSTGGLYLYSGFVVSDSDTEQFLGVANLGGGKKNDGHTEMGFLNRPDAWSSATAEIVKEYAIPVERKLDRRYQGIGTVEVCTLLQYCSRLKEKGYKIQGKELEGVTATARLDNPGSWKSCAKAGMEVVGIKANPDYGPELRYQLCKRM